MDLDIFTFLALQINKYKRILLYTDYVRYCNTWFN